jgi:hypothetical protein
MYLDLQSAGSKLVPRQFSKEICMDINGEKKNLGTLQVSFE